MPLADLRDVYNPMAIKPEAKPPLQAWTDSTPVVLLSEYLKQVGKDNGISLHLDDDGRPVLCMRPGLKASDVGSERWMITENAAELFLDSTDDLMELINAGKVSLPNKNRRVLPKR